MTSSTHCERSKRESIFRNVDNKLALCCKMSGVDILSNDAEKIKQDLDNGIQNPACQMCWDFEALGKKSWRIQGNEHYAEHPKKHKIELYFDNTCDSACVYCNTTYSSKWVQEIKNTKHRAPDWANELVNDKYNWQQTAEYVFEYISNTVKQNSPDDSYEIVLLGGEPLLTSINKKQILELSIESFYKNAHPDTILWFIIQTNANTPKALMLKCIEKVKHYTNKYTNLNFVISVSGESVGKNFEYVRYGCSYERFVENIHLWAESGCFIHTNMAVNPISICSMTQYFEMLVSVAKAHDIQIDVSVNTIYGPAGMSVRLLDDRFSKYCDEALVYIEQEQQWFSNYADMVDKILLIRNLIGTNEDMSDLRKLNQSVNYFQKSRGLVLSDINAELQDYLIERMTTSRI